MHTRCPPIRRGRPARGAAARRTALLTTLHRACLEAVRVRVPPTAWETEVAGLPEGVALGAGRIEVRFDSVPEALQKLSMLAMRSPTITIASPPTSVARPTHQQGSHPT
jgi:hypothetical protein